ncbi:N-acetylmuramoyl-L-alanine amidase family protein [Bariatricus sp. SGI.154]|uniref:N-acetylmuramoyl-L-alanine amidase family protein n=1 Tax=Bariatricus sp. SGI.154 TaxID=3420549 RepID=UPI003D013CEE
MHRKIELVILLLLLAGLVTVSRNLEKQVSGNQVKKGKNTVVIDSGHGGNDPGKIGINDAKEKDINLQIAQKVKTLLEEKGIKVVMTREDDSTLAKETDTNKKVQDMKARVELINNTAPDIAVSIHQNSYQDASVHGAQVFYYTHSEEGEKAATIMQKALLAVDKDNHRQAKEDNTYYLLKRTEVPTIIVECGFLSNPEEADKLVTEDYQQQIAEAIVQGITTCLPK